MKKRFLLFTFYVSLVLVLTTCKKSSNTNTDTTITGTCSDGILNQNETAVDCGGVCSVCQTCFDGVQNQGETGIDCGGPCGKCSLAYSSKGNYGLNIISEDTVIIKASISPNNSIKYYYSFKAELPASTSLKVIIKHTNNPTNNNIWDYTLNSIQGWGVDTFDWSTGSQTFYANGPVVGDLQIYFIGQGSAIINFYKDQETSPSRTKTITWYN